MLDKIPVVLYIYILVVITICNTQLLKSDTTDFPHRSRRQLLWPNSTLLQFNVGIGTPTPHRMINVNWAFQANFQLPWNRSQIPFDLLDANSGYDGLSRRKREEDGLMKTGAGAYESDAKLYHFYKFVEDILTGFGHNGTSCVLQTLCQLGTEPLHSDDDDDLLHEIASFVLDPTNDLEHGLEKSDDNYYYTRAYQRGHNGEDCSLIYGECKISLINMFTKLHPSDL